MLYRYYILGIDSVWCVLGAVLNLLRLGGLNMGRRGRRFWRSDKGLLRSLGIVNEHENEEGKSRLNFFRGLEAWGTAPRVEGTGTGQTAYDAGTTTTMEERYTALQADFARVYGELRTEELGAEAARIERLVEAEAPAPVRNNGYAQYRVNNGHVFTDYPFNDGPAPTEEENND